jgi:hypothetical protein
MCRDRDDLPRRGAQATRHRLTCTPELVSTVLIFALTIPELVNQVRSLIATGPALRERLAEWFAGSPFTAMITPSGPGLFHLTLMTTLPFARPVAR